MGRFTALYFIIAILIILQTMHVSFLYFGAKFLAASSDQSPKKDHLLILSTWRSGSSLVGQFFSQHPDVFYLKEPSWHVWNAMIYSTAYVLHMSVRDLIRSIFKCDMSMLDAYTVTERVSNLFHWASSRALCAPPSCSLFSRTDIVDEAACRKSCGHHPFQKVEDTCNTYSHIVIQEFRISDLTVLYPLLNDPSINLKILHVVRDPRAVAKSREKVKIDLAFDDEIILQERESYDDFSVLQEICKSQAEIYTVANSITPPFPQDRYMLLRYEDLVRKPLKKVREIYSFVNLTLPGHLKSWIYNMTRGPRHKKKINPFIISPRDSEIVSQAWRNVLPLETVNRVQAICKDAIDFFRYRPVDSKEELRDLMIDTVLPRLKDDFIWSDTKNQ